jgi:NitT/TauT family transport system ATP-binding protein
MNDTKDIRSLLPQVIIENVHKVFSSGDREIVALKGITLTISNGEFVCILGPSGCGKSTLLNAIAGFSLPIVGQAGRKWRGRGSARD